jgi:hypothetical protein
MLLFKRSQTLLGGWSEDACKCQVKMSKNAHLKCTILSGQSVVGIIKDIPAFNTVRMTCNLDNIAVMNQTIDYCVSNDRVTEDVRPF